MAHQYRGGSNQQSPQQRTQQSTQQSTSSGTPPPAGAGNQAPAVFTPGKQKLFNDYAERFGVDVDLLIDTMKKTCFRGQKQDSPPITNEQLVALMIVASEYKLNPFTKEIYAYPDKGGGIVPVVSIDGWIRIIQEHPQFDGMDIKHPEQFIVDDSELPEKFQHKPCWEWIEVTITRKDRKVQTPVREYFDEIYRGPTWINKGPNDGYYVAGPWQTHTKRMTRHKGIIQAGRVTFGFAGIYDDDEAQRILSDDRVVSTVPAGEATRPATHTDAAKEALRQRSQSSAARATIPEQGAKQAQQQAHELGRQAGTPPKTDDTREYRSSQQSIKEQNQANPSDDAPWEENDEQPSTAPAANTPSWPPISEKESWISLILTAQTEARCTEIWTAFVDATDKAGLEELDLDVESNYQYRLETLQQK